MNQKGSYLAHGLNQPSSAGISNQLLNRRKQINTLQIFNENVTEVRHGIEYRISFETTNKLSLIMVIFLPPEFPLHSRPHIKVYATQNGSNISHPWLGHDNSVIGSPGLNAYSTHSDLGRVVQAIRREFERNPPVFCHNEHLALISDAASPQVALPNVRNQAHSYRQGPSSQQSIPEIQRLSPEELKKVHDNPKAFNVFFRNLDLSMLSPIEKRSHDLGESINSIIAANKEATAKLKTKHEALMAKSAELAVIKERVSGARSDLRAASANLTKSNICDKLRKASHSDETDSEKCADEFLSGVLPLDDFLADYVRIRTRHNLRKAKCEKM